MLGTSKRGSFLCLDFMEILAKLALDRGRSEAYTKLWQQANDSEKL